MDTSSTNRIGPEAQLATLPGRETPKGEASEYFSTEHLTSDLKGRSVRGGALTLASQGARFFMRMGSAIVLARLLTPRDYGLIAMVTAVTGFVELFKDLGLSMATVQRERIEHAQISTLFWINVALGVGVMLIVSALAPGIAWFYGEPRLVWITLGLSSGFVFGGLTVQHQALLRRQMRFGALAMIQMLSMALGISVAIVAGWQGTGYWALVLMEVTSAMTTAVLVWVLCSWRPSLPVSRSGVGQMLAFGGHLTGFNLANYLARNLDNILIGWRWGSASLGLYSRAYGLLMLPLQQINAPLRAVAVPALSRLQNAPEKYRGYYLKLVSLITFVTVPLITFMMMMSEHLIRLVLGAQWDGASRIFAYLGFAGLVQPVTHTLGWVLISQGRPRHMFQMGLIGAALTVGSIVGGLPWGPTGVAICYAASCLLIKAPFQFWFVGREGAIRARDVYGALAYPSLIGIAVVLLLWTFRSLATGYPSWLLVLGGALVTGGTTLLSLFVIPGGKAMRRDLKKIVEQLSPAARLKGRIQ